MTARSTPGLLTQTSLNAPAEENCRLTLSLPGVTNLGWPPHGHKPYWMEPLTAGCPGGEPGPTRRPVAPL